ncbi:uncharacterized protein C8Q71DRAFT_773928 [Rhodofomes roseus]|uniref:Uncharacterized protein n=1 Tax=Rhodofomes roseus TaxID=34475 RepID=A0ABQ8K8E4_9APHY|nr:uncharacterized protein C8Q71DRAFT_773928 [Rhodofomes roseus]KAH9833544.1 hypothetical protein C8Q71DRAFT_773928 [Rhodofomes roseus]
MRFGLLQSGCLFALAASAYAASLPDKLTLLVPPSHVQVNSTVCPGWSMPADETRYYGFIEAMNITIFAPNGTDISSVGVNTVPDNITGHGDCGSYPGSSYSGCAVVADTGTYTIRWNLTYTMSADPSQANASYCGPAPFSTQIFVLNQTFDTFTVLGQGNAHTNTEITTTTTLPTKPTGNLKVAGALDMRVSGEVGWIGAAAVVIGMMLTI